MVYKVEFVCKCDSVVFYLLCVSYCLDVNDYWVGFQESSSFLLFTYHHCLCFGCVDGDSPV